MWTLNFLGFFRLWLALEGIFQQIHGCAFVFFFHCPKLASRFTEALGKWICVEGLVRVSRPRASKRGGVENLPHFPLKQGFRDLSNLKFVEKWGQCLPVWLNCGPKPQKSSVAHHIIGKVAGAIISREESWCLEKPHGRRDQIRGNWGGLKGEQRG